ncbi:MAG: YicC family protein [Oceanicaulis sp.]|uniref:YicC/YloC family endoribonuclease n=1 Tax=Glycocaulis sp. TaxID=1969725 RepID=UPI0025BC7A68|nr:YicC/YloC family endoribonuclease [Glycocaulis sp.]MCC5981970.1 YicC family protein [Oceanicaulis sp.]MCH8521860.1 YicC family protein [Glycocaulis sp.]
MATLSGMTGFARASASGDYGTLSAEARSVNGRGLDIRLRLPDGLAHLEGEVRSRIKTAFERGSVSLNISLEKPASLAGALMIDTARLRALAEAGQDLVKEGLVQPARLDGLLALRGVVLSEDTQTGGEDTAEVLDSALLALTDEVLAGLRAARDAEGAALLPVLTAQVDEIEALRVKAAAHPATSTEAIRDRLKAKFDELLPGGLEPERLAQEAAALAVKADVREEIDRLAGHVEAARSLLAGGSPCGRKLDFLTQEFNREANTLCSKAADRGLTELGLAMKHVVDQLREQVQNVE